MTQEGPRLNIVFTLQVRKEPPFGGCRLHPIFGVIACPAWEAIAEPALPLTWDTFDTSRIQEHENSVRRFGIHA